MTKDSKDEFKRIASILFLWINTLPDTAKLTFKIDDSNFHYTIRVWKKERFIDLHKTDESYPVGDLNRYSPICRISFFGIGRVLVGLKNLDHEHFFMRMLKSKITVGKLKRYRCVLYPLDQREDQMQTIFKIKKKRSGTKVKFDKDLDLSVLGTFIPPEDALNHPVKAFMVWRVKKGCLLKNGFVYRLPLNKFHGDRSFVYFSPKLEREFMKMGSIVFRIALTQIKFNDPDSLPPFVKKLLSGLSR